MNQKLLIRAKIILKDNRFLLAALAVWFLGGFSFYYFRSHLGVREALKAAFFFSNVPGDFSAGYLMWSQAIVFGFVFTLFVNNVFEKYNPERGCRMYAKEMKGHTVVIGYSHLGQRLVDFLRRSKAPYSLVEKDASKVDELLREGEPIVVDDARESESLVDAGVCTAKSVVICSNNIETALIATKRARDCNKDCSIITRCHRDEFDEVLRSLGATEVISSSQSALKHVTGILGIAEGAAA